MEARLAPFLDGSQTRKPYQGQPMYKEEEVEQFLLLDSKGTTTKSTDTTNHSKTNHADHWRRGNPLFVLFSCQKGHLCSVLFERSTVGNLFTLVFAATHEKGALSRTRAHSQGRTF